MKILGIGNALVDILAKLNSDETLAELNLPKGSMQLIDELQRNYIFNVTQGLPQKMTAGGSASNTLTALAKMGVHTGFIGKIGNDKYGQFYKEDVSGIGVNPHLIQKAAPSGTAMALISTDGERTFGTYLGISAELSTNDLSKEIFRQYNYLYVEGYLVQNYELIESSMRIAQDLGMKVVIDTASYNVVESNRDFFWKLIDQYVDIVFANEEEAGALTQLPNPVEAIEMIAPRVDIAVVKTGSKGALAMQGGNLVEVPALSAQVIDATAAGDFYAAGFLYGLYHKKSLQHCARLGTLFAANIIEVVGTRLDDNSWNKIRMDAEKILSSLSLN